MTDVFKSQKRVWTQMLLYHASLETVKEPIVFNRYKTLDFGTGFYTTPNESQAQEFAIKAYLRLGALKYQRSSHESGK